MGIDSNVLTLIKTCGNLKSMVLVLGVQVMFCGCILGGITEPIAAPSPLPAVRVIAEGSFEPTWDSLIEGYKCPEWFRDAKLGIWAHWSAQCVPEQGDWYARNIYIQGLRQYDYHVKHFGHPSEFGFMEIDNLWKAEKWDPETLMRLFVEAGAKYFVAMANHEDNFDTYDSKYHAWNSVHVGPKRDIVGTWAKTARNHGLRFGVSNHSSHAWHWFQTAYGYDAEGDKAGVRYDAYTLTKADGVGKWWEGLDPQELYCRPAIVMPDGITDMQKVRKWHVDNNSAWTENPPENDQHFVDKWFYRLQDLIDSYQPDFLYLDNTGLPLGQTGLDIAAHYYNASMMRNEGKLDVVLTSKGLRGDRQRAMVQDFERSATQGIQSLPFETGTCIGQWHYWKDYEYKSIGHIVRLLVDVVSKNGTLLLSIPQRGDGTIDEREVAILKGLGRWMKVNGQGIYGTRPWKTFGEGPTEVPKGRAGDLELPYTPEDIRFTLKDGQLYMFVMALPEEDITVEALGFNSEFAEDVGDIEMLGSKEKMVWEQGGGSLRIGRPREFPSENVIGFKVSFK